ncbi:MAG: 50S ribosomal protein L9 [bacterium]|nr:50S ribosomal protein L9 [bacterium]
MKVVLLQDIKGIGRKHDVKNVKDGYARNFLLAKKLAVIADGHGLKLKSEADASERAVLQKHQDAANAISKQALEFKVKVGDKKEVFGSVNRDMIASALKEKGFDVADVLLAQPLKKIGDHTVEITIGRGIKGKVKVTLIQ